MALSRGLTRLLAVTCGVTVANVYFAHPLLHTIARGLGTGQATAGFVVTATQLGFAAGLLLVVPLGDIIARRPLITTLLAVDAVALAASAAAPRLAVLGALAVLIGVSSVVVQMLIPYAATLARDEERAATIGTLMGAVLLGILLSRTFAGGALGTTIGTATYDRYGWHGACGVAAGFCGVALLGWLATHRHERAGERNQMGLADASARTPR